MHTFLRKNYISDGLSLGIFRSECKRDEPPHDHDFIEMVYVTSGSGTQSINGKEYEAVRGDLFFINYESTHKFTTKDGFCYINLCLDPEIIFSRIINRDNAFDLLSLTAIDELRGEGAPEGRIHFTRYERPLIESLLSDMISEYESNLPERGAVLESYMTILIAKILRKTRLRSERDADVWGEMIRFVDLNLDKKLSLSDLAKRCFYNPSYFSRAFKERFGTSLVDYVTRARADAAAVLLESTDLPTETIAEKCGFGDKTGLYRAFSRYFGMTPSEYRRTKT